MSFFPLKFYYDFPANLVHLLRKHGGGRGLDEFLLFLIRGRGGG